MEYFERKSDATQVIYFPGKAIQVLDRDPELYISRIGLAQCSGQYKVTFLTPYYWGLIAIEGKASLRVKGLKSEIRPGDLMIVRSDEESYFEECPDEPFKYLWFDLKGTNASDIIKSIFKSHESGLFKGKGKAVLDDINELKNAFQKDSHSGPQTISCAWKLLETIDKKSFTVNDAAYSCKVIIDTEFAKGVSVSEIAEKLAVNRSTLYRKFKDAYSCSPKQYLDKLKLDHSQKLLKTTSLPIKQIAYESGFDNIQHFYLMFKKTFKTSPLQTRE